MLCGSLLSFLCLCNQRSCPFFHFFFFFFSHLHLRHMEVLRLGVISELQLPSYTTATATPDPSTSVTHATAYGNTWILNPLIRPDIELESSQDYVRFLTSWIPFLMGTPFLSFFLSFGRICDKWKFRGYGSNWSCSYWSTPQPQQCRIFNPPSKARDRTQILIETTLRPTDFSN